MMQRSKLILTLFKLFRVTYFHDATGNVKEIMLERLLFQSQRSWSESVNDEENKDICYLGRLPNEMLEIIASHTIKDFNPARYRFFANYVAAREKADFKFLQQNIEKLPYLKNLKNLHIDTKNALLYNYFSMRCVFPVERSGD
ncbi:TPA: hypothetical protein ACT96X_003160 [Legionella pneumophila]|nr:hypothetical protein [Legionella pneumophila]